MSNSDKKTNSKENFSVYPSKKVLFLLLGGVIVMLFIAVYLFTRSAFISAFSLTDKGTIGDAINGITGPIIALISAGLLFYSFQAQLEANKRQLEANKMLKSQWEFDTYYRLFGEIERAYKENFRTTVKRRAPGLGGSTDAKEYEGWSYLHYFTNNMNHYLDEEDEESNKFMFGFLSTIEFLLEDLIILTNYVKESEVSQKHFFLHRIERFYHTSLESPLKEVYDELPNEPRFQKSHDVYNRLAATIQSLRENELKTDILGRK